MIIKYFDEFDGNFIDITGNTGSTLAYGAEGWTTSQGYLSLIMLISQSGGDDPDLVELENTTGMTVTPVRTAAGDYRLNFSDTLLSQGKTFIMIQQTDTSPIYANRQDEDTISVTTNGDDILNFTSFELRIYN
jgi:hypothetical protein